MIKPPWVDLNTDLRNYGFESRSLETLCKELYKYSMYHPEEVNRDENPFDFIVNLAKNTKIPFIHIFHPKEIASDPSKYENLSPRDTPQTVDEMYTKLTETGLTQFWKEEENPNNRMKLMPSGKDRIFIICRAYTLWTGNFLKLLRTHSDEYPQFSDLQVRYRDGMTKGLEMYEKNRTEKPGHHNWMEITLDGKNWITFEPIYPGDKEHPPENYFTMDKIYKTHKLNLKHDRFIDPIQMYTQFATRDVLFLLNETVPTRHYTDLIYVLKSGKRVLIEQRKQKEMSETDIERFKSGNIKIGSMFYGLPKEKEVFEEIERDVIPLLVEPDVKKLREVRKKIKVVLYPPYGK